MTISPIVILPVPGPGNPGNGGIVPPWLRDEFWILPMPEVPKVDK